MKRVGLGSVAACVLGAWGLGAAWLPVGCSTSDGGAASGDAAPADAVLVDADVETSLATDAGADAPFATAQQTLRSTRGWAA
jgi:hypothetical protein